MHRFLPTLLRMQGYRVIEMDVNHRPRRAGVSKYGINNR
jgi:dolichol-phosphate mannosyltransferase